MAVRRIVADVQGSITTAKATYVHDGIALEARVGRASADHQPDIDTVHR
jgi:hypothetical protein